MAAICSGATTKLCSSLGRIVARNVVVRKPIVSSSSINSSARGLATFSCNSTTFSKSTTPPLSISSSRSPFTLQSRGLQAWVHSLSQEPDEGTEAVDTDDEVLVDDSEDTDSEETEYEDVVAIEKSGITELDDDVFGAPPRLDILHRVVVWQRREWWQGTAKAKGRAEVRGGGKKPWRQKGSGRARASSIRSPIFKGGGVVHGPKPRNHSIKLPIKVHQMGMRVALSVKYAQGDLTILEDMQLPSSRTKVLNEALKKHKSDYSALFVHGDESVDMFTKAARNIPRCDVISFEDISVYNILLRHKLFITRSALAELEEKFKIDDTYIRGVNVPDNKDDDEEAHENF